MRSLRDAVQQKQVLLCVHYEEVATKIFLALMLPFLFRALATRIVSFNSESVFTKRALI